jgi:hypothetical protein
MLNGHYLRTFSQQLSAGVKTKGLTGTWYAGRQLRSLECSKSSIERVDASTPRSWQLRAYHPSKT